MKKILVCALALALTGTAAFAEFGFIGGLGYTFSIQSFEDSLGTLDYSTKAPAVFALIHGNKAGAPAGWYASVSYAMPSELDVEMYGVSGTLDNLDTAFVMDSHFGISVASPGDSFLFYVLGAGLGIDITSVTTPLYELTCITTGLGLDAVGGIKIIPKVTIFAAIRDTYCPIALVADDTGVDLTDFFSYSNSLNISVGAGFEF